MSISKMLDVIDQHEASTAEFDKMMDKPGTPLEELVKFKANILKSGIDGMSANWLISSYSQFIAIPLNYQDYSETPSQLGMVATLEVIKEIEQCLTK
jgi:hypothetical protein